MHLRFTDDELVTLGEMLTLACWATYWNHKPGADDGVARFEHLLKKVLERMQHNGQSDQLEYDQERKHLKLRSDMEDNSFHAQCYDEMRSETFWEELVIRMADRELAQRYGQQKLDGMNESELKQMREPVAKRYWAEFSAHGIENLHLVSKAQSG